MNGERVSGPTAIVDIGGSVLVNSAYLAPPFDVAAIGPRDLFSSASCEPGLRRLRATAVVTFGLKISFAESDAVGPPAYAGSVTLRNARTVPTSPAP